MGFRSTMTTGEWALLIPKSFLEKYPYVRAYEIKEGPNKGEHGLPLSLNKEIKFYSSFEDCEMFKDIQKLMIEQDSNKDIDLILLHECGGITKVIISKTEIKGLEPTEWREVKNVEHNYCYGCSEGK